MLYWNVQSELDGEALVEITYFTSGIHWSADYVGIADADETQMNLEGFVRVDNQSGEEYEDAQVRLVVGRVNLVEKIAQLAQALGKDMDRLAEGEKREMKFRAMRELSDGKKDGCQRRRRIGGRADGRARQEAPKEVVKEGLGEYFIYTIEGTETIPNGWSKRLRSLEAAKVPVKIQYRYRPAEYGENLVRMYLLTNNKESKLGTTPLPDGTFRALSPERPRRAELPRRAVDQVRSHRRQDRAESGRRSGGDFRIGQAPIVARRHLDAGAGREPFPARRPAGREDPRE